MCMLKYTLTDSTTSIKYDSLRKMSERIILPKYGSLKALYRYMKVHSD